MVVIGSGILKELQIQYKKILADYLNNQSERNLYIGQNFIRQLIKKKITPEEVVSMHKQAMEELCPQLPPPSAYGYDFLIEIMVHFGLTLKERQSLLERQEELRIEMNIAAKIQNMLLQTPVPNTESIDIGIVSVPIRKMNGDYVHFLMDDNTYVGVAVTDVVGKGVPAALCMSMVKYGLDTLAYAENNPAYVLEVLNRIIEKSIDDSMFVSMFYGRFDIANNVFTYGSAGHEPALYYCAAEDKYYDLESKGLLLGVLPEVKYSQSEIHLQKNDFIIIMTDGVTEFRKDDTINSREIIENLARNLRHLNAQQMCEALYEEMQRLQEFGLEDDFTVVILKK